MSELSMVKMVGDYNVAVKRDLSKLFKFLGNDIDDNTFRFEIENRPMKYEIYGDELVVEYTEDPEVYYFIGDLSDNGDYILESKIVHYRDVCTCILTHDDYNREYAVLLSNLINNYIDII